MSKGNFDRVLVAAHHLKSAAELVDLDVDALKGVSEGDKRHLLDAFGIRSIGDLARHRFVRAARAIDEEAASLDHDPGPDADWSAFFAGAPLATYEEHPENFRLDFGPAYYRGRLDGTARVLVVGQDPAPNELIGHRVFVGTSGQRVQGFLRRLGIRRDYLMVNAFLYPVFGQFFGTLVSLTEDPAILGYRNRLFDRIARTNALEVVITVGRAAEDAVARWPGSAGLTTAAIMHPSARDPAALMASWNHGLDQLRSRVSPESAAPEDSARYGDRFVPADQEPIPRRDLPFGVPHWHGHGTRATRARGTDGETDHKRIIWRAP